MKKVITKAERLQLLGLVTLGVKYAQLVQEVEQLMADIVEDDPGGHLSDALWENTPNLDEKLRYMEVVVEQ